MKNAVWVGISFSVLTVAATAAIAQDKSAQSGSQGEAQTFDQVKDETSVVPQKMKVVPLDNEKFVILLNDGSSVVLTKENLKKLQDIDLTKPMRYNGSHCAIIKGKKGY